MLAEEKVAVIQRCGMDIDYEIMRAWRWSGNLVDGEAAAVRV
jgi:hypothetical protein